MSKRRKVSSIDRGRIGGVQIAEAITDRGNPIVTLLLANFGDDTRDSVSDVDCLSRHHHDDRETSEKMLEHDDADVMFC